MHCASNYHPKLIFAGTSCIDLCKKISRDSHHNSIQISPVVLTPHPNGECMVRGVADNMRSRDVFIVQSICRLRNFTSDNPYTGVNDMLMELLAMGNTARLASAHSIIAVIPYFGYARQDRKNASRTPITAKLVADLLETTGFNRVLTLDLHAAQIQGFFNPSKCVLDHLNAGPIITEYFNSLDLKKPVIVCPDLGNVKKMDKYKASMSSNIEMAIIDKRRDPHTGAVTATRLIGDVENKDVLMCDDIISTAGTLREAVDLLAKNRVRSVYIAATHGEFIGKSIEKLSHPLIKEIAVTDTIPVLPEVMDRLPIKILSVAPLFAKAINCIHAGESLSDLC